MTHWFDARASRANGQTPDQRRKVGLIKDALKKSNKELQFVFHQILLAEGSAIRFGPVPASPGGPRRLPLDPGLRKRLGAELLAAAARLGALHTGLQAELLLRESLVAAAAGTEAWYAALNSDDGRTIFHAEQTMAKQFAKAEKLHEAGLAYLEKGR
jgi:hypothetical protein